MLFAYENTCNIMIVHPFLHLTFGVLFTWFLYTGYIKKNNPTIDFCSLIKSNYTNADLWKQ